ncbi:hypothetical protein [Anaerotruncus rubiinfantis]|uniref:hypothetical protein n=1 Tax=Anaerotruncus rubiinfantis TaxID=1720200 RepID=UPI0034A41C87
MAKGYFHGQKGGGKAFDILNFPLSVQPEQPTAKAVGHVWVKLTADEAAQITHVVMDDAIRLNYTDGYLIFKLPDAGVGYESITQPKKTTSGVKLPFAFLHQPETIPEWQTGYTEEIADIKYPWPSVNYRLGGSLKPAEAFVWNGSGWTQFSFKSSYFVHSLTSEFSIYDTSTQPFEQLTVVNSPIFTTIKWHVFSPDGKYFLVYDSGTDKISVFSVNGKIITCLYSQSLSSPTNSTVAADFSYDSKFLVLLFKCNNTSTLELHFLRVTDTELTLENKTTLNESKCLPGENISCAPNSYKVAFVNWNGIVVYTFDQNGVVRKIYSDYSSSTIYGNSSMYIQFSPSGNYLLAAYGYDTPFSVYLYTVEGETIIKHDNALGYTMFYSGGFAFTPDEQFIILSSSTSNSRTLYMCLFQFQPENTDSFGVLLFTDNGVRGRVLCPKRPGYLFLGSTGAFMHNLAKSYSNNQLSPTGDGTLDNTFVDTNIGANWISAWPMRE